MPKSDTPLARISVKVNKQEAWTLVLWRYSKLEGDVVAIVRLSFPIEREWDARITLSHLKIAIAKESTEGQTMTFEFYRKVERTDQSWRVLEKLTWRIGRYVNASDRFVQNMRIPAWT